MNVTRSCWAGYRNGQLSILTRRGNPLTNLRLQLCALGWTAILILSSQMIVKADSILSDGAKLEKISSAYDFTEGPACDAQGDVYFTDQPNDRIVKWSTAGKLSIYMHPAG